MIWFPLTWIINTGMNTGKSLPKNFQSYEILMWLKRAQATPEFHLL